MRVHIRDVDGVPSQRTGKTRWTIFWQWDRVAYKSDGRVHTWSDWEAALCQRAKDQRRTVELVTVETAWGPRVQSVNFTSEAVCPSP